MKYPTITIELLPLSALFPNHWSNWIYDAISQDAPFSWGDNDHTLINAERFKSYLQSVFDWVRQDVPEELEKYQTSILETLDTLEEKGIYICLEN